MPKQYLTSRPSTEFGGHRFVHIIEFSYWDIFRMLFGREVETVTAEGKTMLRCDIAYSAFNMSAGTETERKLPPKAQQKSESRGDWDNPRPSK